MNYLDATRVEAIHDAILNPAELKGRALDKSLESTLARVENRLVYGMVEDAYHLAALYAEVIARGHCFNDGNKRTAYRVMIVCLYLNGIRISHETTEVGDRIIALARGDLDAEDLADWLRRQ